VSAVAAGGNGSYVLKADGTVWAWGGTSCGDGGTVEQIAAGAPLIDHAAAISAGSSHFLILRDDGTLWACGHGEQGQLGNGTTDVQKHPTQIGGSLFNLQAVAAGFQYSAARTDDGTTWTWGDNSQGQLGTGDKTGHATPSLVYDGTGLLSRR
jgi:alpha-tubulin suppressor-like RCC1 family protein